MSKHRGDFEVCRTIFGRSFGHSRTITATSASTLTLNSFSTAYQFFDGATAGQVVNLGDATTYFKDGHTFIFLNDSDNPISIEDDGGTELLELGASSWTIAILEDGSTVDGVWRFLQVLEIDQIPIDALTQFEAFESEGEQSTTSNGWVLKSGYPYTTTSKPPGTYVIDHTVQVGQSDKEKNIGHRVQWRPGTTGSWTTLLDIRDAVSTDDAFQVRTGFNIVDLPLGGVFQVRIQFGQTDEGGTGKIKEANIKIGKATD